MVYRLLEERSKKGAGRSMRALAWRVCAWVLPLYRNLEPITRKPLGGGSGDTSLQWRDGGEEGGSHLLFQVQGWTTAGLSSHCPTSYTLWSRRGKKREVFPMILTTFSSCSALKKHRHHPHIHSQPLSHPQLPHPQVWLTGRMCGAQCRPSTVSWLNGGLGV